MLDRFLGGLDRGAPHEVLDYGCGCGSSLAAIRAHFPHARLTGADPDAFTLSIARARFDGQGEPPDCCSRKAGACPRRPAPATTSCSSTPWWNTCCRRRARHCRAHSRRR
ncbi:class I SAM-dependent methyltransferase [Rubritepida flocculans]|uniref:class I SAM-dependent methyltransferase n=1 Tax=Rubritepida flocculans TaxID=182403 RepID=UPI0038CDC84C